MTYVEENTKKLEELKKLPYETLAKMRKEIMNNPKSTRADIINISVACAERGIKEGKRLYTQEEIEREFGVEKNRILARG